MLETSPRPRPEKEITKRMHVFSEDESDDTHLRDLGGLVTRADKLPNNRVNIGGKQRAK